MRRCPWPRSKGQTWAAACRDSRFVVLDRGGAVLHASPAASYAPGSRLESEMLWHTVKAQLRGGTEMRGKDGSDWYASHAAAGTPDDPHATSVVYEIPSAELLALAAHDRQLRATAERYAGQNPILQLIAQNHPLDRTLDKLARFIEGRIDEAIDSIVIPDPAGARIARCIGPHLPETYKTAPLGLEIGPDTGSCGAAMHEEKPVITEDIDRDPRWDSYRHLAQAHGLAACWSWPNRAACRDRSRFTTGIRARPAPISSSATRCCRC
jgi:hypothetical protein